VDSTLLAGGKSKKKETDLEGSPLEDMLIQDLQVGTPWTGLVL
jgi:hypothetical protein